MADTLDLVLLLALPASGKSEVRRYMKSLTPAQCRDDFHMGPTVQIDDFPYVHMMRRVDEELAALGLPPLYFHAVDRGFRNDWDWGTLIALVNEDYEDLVAKRVVVTESAANLLLDRMDDAAARAGIARRNAALPAEARRTVVEKLEREARAMLDEKHANSPDTLEGKTVVIEFARGGADGSALPLAAPFGYQYSLAQLSQAILEKASILYVWVTPEESRRKNFARTDPNDPGSILHHGVPIDVMMNDYGCDDMTWLEDNAHKAGTVTVRAHGGKFHIPVGRFDNRVDKTSFLRAPQSGWSPADVAAVHAGLAGALDLLHAYRTPKVTYLGLTADNQSLHARIDAAIAKVKANLGQTWPLLINGEHRTLPETFESRSPADTRVVLGRACAGTTRDVNDAVAAAKAALPAWRQLPWQERVRFIERAARLVREEKFELAALVCMEVGKNRVEALGEVEEVADLYDYYAEQVRTNAGFVASMNRLSPNDTNTSVLRPYGVWVVISPWNFPGALLGGPIAAALLAGNTVVAKPSSDTPIVGARIVELFHHAGLPAGTVNLVMGSGRLVGDPLAMHPDVDGLTFTGSYEIGFDRLYKRFSAKYPKPCIVEMGGKNAAIVMDTADLDRAVLGVYRSAFGMNGQKCSACSRVYVHTAVYDAFVARLVEKVNALPIGDPLDKTTYLGPVATKGGYEDFQRFVAMAKADGKILAGGELLKDAAFAHGYYVQPTIFAGVPRDHELVKTELFVPILYVERITSLDEALTLANDVDLGLTAGFYSAHPHEIDTFLDRIEAGVVYVNRAAGATTGAWPGVQPFGGWKGSGSTGKNIGGLYSVQCYLREQSRTLTR